MKTTMLLLILGLASLSLADPNPNPNVVQFADHDILFQTDSDSTVKCGVEPPTPPLCKDGTGRCECGDVPNPDGIGEHEECHWVWECD